MGLLGEPGRTEAGDSLYDATDLERVNFIRSAQELGFTLEQARQLLALRASDTAHAQAVLDITLAKIADAEARLERLSDIRDMLRMLADECPGEVPVSDCPILPFLPARRQAQQNNQQPQEAPAETPNEKRG